MNRGFVIRGGEGLVVVDKPKYPWRGLMLDPARHFITVAEVQKQIDAMAQVSEARMCINPFLKLERRRCVARSRSLH